MGLEIDCSGPQVRQRGHPKPNPKQGYRACVQVEQTRQPLGAQESPRAEKGVELPRGLRMGSIGLRLARRWTFYKPSCRAALPAGHSGRVFHLAQYGAHSPWQLGQGAAQAELAWAIA